MGAGAGRGLGLGVGPGLGTMIGKGLGIGLGLGLGIGIGLGIGMGLGIGLGLRTSGQRATAVCSNQHMPLRLAYLGSVLFASSRPKAKASHFPSCSSAAAHSSAQAWASLNTPIFVSSLPHSACSFTSVKRKLRHASSVHRDGLVHSASGEQLYWHSRRSSLIAASSSPHLVLVHDQPIQSEQSQPLAGQGPV